MNDSELIMLKGLRKIEHRLNDRLIDFVIWWSYLGDFRPKFFDKIKKIGLDAYAHILAQYERFKERYRN